MPSETPKQHRFMEWIAHGGHRQGGPSAAVAKEFVAADKAKGMAEGGEVKRRDTPAEGMPGLVGVEDPGGDHFLVHFADGTSAPVLKKGLKDDTLAHIQGMAHGGQVIAGGGVRVESEGSSPGDPEPTAYDPAPPDKSPVIHKPASTPTEDDPPSPQEEDKPKPKGYAQGGEVQGDPYLNAAAPPPLPQMDGSLPEEQGLLSSWLAPGREVQNILQARGEGAVSPKSGVPLNEHGAAERIANAPGNLATMAQDAVYNALPPELRTGLTPPGQAPGAGLDQDAQAAADATAKAMRQAPAPSGPTVPGASLPSGRTAGGGALTELDKGLAEQRAGLTAQVEAEKARDAALLQLQDKHLAQMQALEAGQAEQMAAHQRRADDLFQATLNAKIDPQRVWASADIGQRIGAGIGILLSGIGQGLAGGPNMAMQVIDRTIDRDIDAQKTNLENQKGLLSYYLQQGRDMVSAHQLAKADLKDMLAAQVLRVSAEFGGQEAAARAQLVGGQLRTEAAGKRQEIIARGFQIEQARMAMEQQMAVRRLMTSGTMHPAMAALIGGGPEKMAEHMVQVPRDVTDRAGLPHQVMETRYVFPGLKAEKAADAVMENRLIGGKAARLKAFVEAHPHGTLSPQETQQARDLVADLSLSWNKSQEGLNRLNEREADMLKGMIQDPSELHVSGKYAQSVDDLLAAVNAKRRAIEDQYLIPQ